MPQPSETAANTLAEIDNLIANASAYRSEVERLGPNTATDTYVCLQFMRAVNAVSCLYTDELHEMIVDVADTFCEDADGEYDPYLARERLADRDADREWDDRPFDGEMAV